MGGRLLPASRPTRAGSTPGAPSRGTARRWRCGPADAAGSGGGRVAHPGIERKNRPPPAEPRRGPAGQRRALPRGPHSIAVGSPVRSPTLSDAPSRGSPNRRSSGASSVTSPGRSTGNSSVDPLDDPWEHLADLWRVPSPPSDVTASPVSAALSVFPSIHFSPAGDGGCSRKDRETPGEVPGNCPRVPGATGVSLRRFLPRRSVRETVTGPSAGRRGGRHHSRGRGGILSCCPTGRGQSSPWSISGRCRGGSCRP